MCKLAHIGISILLLLSGCSTFTVDKKAWIGKPESELISDWGKPASRSSDGKDGWILVYRDKMKPAYFQSYKQDGSEEKYAVYKDVIVRTTIFYLDKNGKIYQVDSIDRGIFSEPQVR